jgi:ureidoacrylate peracid hydrolase
MLHVSDEQDNLSCRCRRCILADLQEELLSLADPRSAAVLVVDVQNIFTSLPLFPPAQEVLPCLQRFLDHARAAEVLIIYSQVIIPVETYSEVWKRQFGADNTWIAPGTKGIEIDPMVAPRTGDLTVVKHRYSAFLGTPLESILHTRAIGTVILTGLTTDVCVGSTARDAFQRDFHVITLADCTAEVSQACHESGLETLARNFGMVCSSTEVVRAWEAQMALTTVAP